MVRLVVEDEWSIAHVGVWMQYVLDNFASVAEAVAWVGESQLRIGAQEDPLSGRAVTLHLALDDASGDSAIVEYLEDARRSRASGPRP
jgi:choloylglycine hydrolase